MDRKSSTLSSAVSEKEEAIVAPETDEKKDEFFDRNLTLYQRIFSEIKNEAVTRTEFCKHRIYSCYMHALEGFLKNFFYGVVVKTGVNLAFGMLNPRKKLIPALKKVLSFDTLLFSLFGGGFICLFRLIL